MALVKRGNVELEINDACLSSYMSKGYDLIDEKGNILSKGVPFDINSLKLSYTEALNKVSKLKKENEALNKENQGLYKQVEELTKKLKDKSKSDK